MMTSNDGTRKLSDRPLQDQETSSMEVHDRVLLQALQNFVVPLIRTVDQKTQISTHSSIISDFKAGKLITALHEFISGIIVRSQSRTQGVIRVSLDEENIKHAGGLKETEEKQGTLICALRVAFVMKDFFFFQKNHRIVYGSGRRTPWSSVFQNRCTERRYSRESRADVP
ncbi:hypothetical protein BJ912DRAFT_111292 [Pholiota molesta]|nr:hypothetical protein BJ912DRAFT_111292 [Pholiota molesta]